MAGEEKEGEEVAVVGGVGEAGGEEAGVDDLMCPPTPTLRVFAMTVQICYDGYCHGKIHPALGHRLRNRPHGIGRFLAPPCLKGNTGTTITYSPIQPTYDDLQSHSHNLQ